MRSVWTTPVLRIKHIEEKEEGNVTVIEGHYLDHNYDKIVVKVRAVNSMNYVG